MHCSRPARFRGGSRNGPLRTAEHLRGRSFRVRQAVRENSQRPDRRSHVHVQRCELTPLQPTRTDKDVHMTPISHTRDGGQVA